MASKRNSSQRRKPADRSASPASTPTPTGRWRQWGLLLTIIPMLAGLILFVAAWADWVFIGTQTGQTVAGALLALLGFAASNALQGKWLPTAGWIALGIAVALAVGLSHQPWGLPGGVLFGVMGLGLIVAEFVRQYRRQKG